MFKKYYENKIKLLKHFVKIIFMFENFHII